MWSTDLKWLVSLVNTRAEPFEYWKSPSMVVLGVVEMFGRTVIDSHTTLVTEMVLAMVMLDVAVIVIVIVILTMVVTTVIEFVTTTVVAVVAVTVVVWKGGGTVDQTLAHPYVE